ncbi:malonyl-CoA-acyl carrier protein transacylase, mitochondrial [Aplysia californica]|uniref:Malonyl-CoA-acyl carrier protein transacylase, mitochondrial n=1 Tax=Aplysia californica TaxID=6500 RepID=A0ABM0JCI3_APLCA|nr:malonyl-CoA-acyl carrier protein transacylase, mitochondrial [Aplysia californica]
MAASVRPQYRRILGQVAVGRCNGQVSSSRSGVVKNVSLRTHFSSSRSNFADWRCRSRSSGFLSWNRWRLEKGRYNEGHNQQSTVIDRRGTVGLCPSIRLFSSSHNGDSNSGDNGDYPQDIRVLPRRLVKRLKKQGISEAEFLTKINANSKSSDMFPPPSETDFRSAAPVVDSKEELESLLKLTSVVPKFVSEADSFPSDTAKYQDWKKQNSERTSKSVPKVSPSTTSIVLFPGQGSQFIGMSKQLLHFPGVHDLFEEASSLLGYDLLEICLAGPKSELDKTIYCQPAVMITSLAAIEKLREEHPKAVENCVATAGFSVGEFSALVFSGVISFPDAVKLVKVRAEAMQRASETVSSGMLTVFLAHDSDLKGAMRMAKEYCQTRRGINEPVCNVANFLFPECKVIAGHAEALEFISTNAKEFRILRTKRLPVSGAFHTQLMASARRPLEQALQGMKIGKPKLPIYSNVTGQPYHAKTNFAHMLGEQLVKPVRWEQTMHALYQRPQGSEFPHTYEVGPGKQMGTLLKQVNLQAHKQYHDVRV